MTGTHNLDAYKLDMSMMLTIHDAFRRELERILRVASRTDDDPANILRTAIGWRLFKTYLTIHHTTEDETVWGLMEQRLIERPSDQALLAAMETEHAAINPLLQEIDDALADRDEGHKRIHGIAEELNNSLRGHLLHEEADGLALVDSVLTQQEWASFAQLHLKRVGNSVGTYLPWLLDDASEEWVETVLSHLPPFGRTSYEGGWKAAYDQLDLWVPATNGDNG